MNMNTQYLHGGGGGEQKATNSNSVPVSLANPLEAGTSERVWVEPQLNWFQRSGTRSLASGRWWLTARSVGTSERCALTWDESQTNVCSVLLLNGNLLGKTQFTPQFNLNMMEYWLMAQSVRSCPSRRRSDVSASCHDVSTTFTYFPKLFLPPHKSFKLTQEVDWVSSFSFS